MAVVEVTELPSQEGTLTAATQTAPGKNTYTRQFKIVVDHKDYEPQAIYAQATALPRLHDYYSMPNGSTDVGSRVRAITFSRMQAGSTGDLFHWQATVAYDADTNPPPDQSGGLPPPVVSVVFRKVPYTPFKDMDGKPYVNTAGQFFDPPPERIKTVGAIAVTWAAYYFNASLAFDYADAVNESTFWGKEAGTLHIEEISAQQVISATQAYWSITVVVGYDEAKWADEFLNAGMMQKNDDGKLIPCRTTDGEPTTAPVPLDAAGKQIDLSAVDPEDYENELHFVEFKQRPVLNFASLGLPAI